jgi:hypothetical protein
MDIRAFSPKSFQFWASNEARPKRAFEAILVFPDLIFGGDGMQNIEPFLVSRFSRPGYSQIDTDTAEYQLGTGDFAKIEYPTGGYRTSALNITLLDVVNHNKGANTAAAVNASLIMQGKTSKYQEMVSGEKNQIDGIKEAQNFQKAWTEYPKNFVIIEFDNKGQTVGEWRIRHPILTSVTFSEINYRGSGFSTIDLSFSYQDFHYNSSWGEKLLSNRLEMLGKDRKVVEKTLDKWQTKINKSMNWASKIK